MSLLIYTPTIGDQMRPETRASIEAQITTVPHVWEIGHHNPFPGEKMRNVVAQYQRAWQMALDGGFDGLLTIEHDMIPPSDAVQRLWETDAPVVYGVYMLRHGIPTLNAWQLVNRRNIGMSLSLYPAELRQAWARGWAEVSGVGWGCTLIRREVLVRTSVQASAGDAGDIRFATDCLRGGIRQIARFDVSCGHIDHTGRVLHPTTKEGIVNRVYVLQTVTANVEGSSMPLTAGKYYSLPPQTAFDLARAGFVRITNDDDSQEEAGEKEQPDITSRELATDPKVVKRSTRGKRAS